MAENLYTVQKTYEALVATDADAAKKLAFDESRIFKTEYERQQYLVRLTGDSLRAAITWLEKSENSGVSKQENMLKLLKAKESDLVAIQGRTRAELSGHALIIDATVKGLEYKAYQQG